jgi:hypothetical protein
MAEVTKLLNRKAGPTGKPIPATPPRIEPTNKNPNNGGKKQ